MISEPDPQRWCSLPRALARFEVTPRHPAVCPLLQLLHAALRTSSQLSLKEPRRRALAPDPPAAQKGKWHRRLGVVWSPQPRQRRGYVCAESPVHPLPGCGDGGVGSSRGQQLLVGD